MFKSVSAIDENQFSFFSKVEEKILKDSILNILFILEFFLSNFNFFQNSFTEIIDYLSKLSNQIIKLSKHADEPHFKIE